MSRFCCQIDCDKPAEWELWASNSNSEFVDACSDHVGHLLDDAPYTYVYPIKEDAADTDSVGS